MKYVVYVLESEKDGKYYVGQTIDFARRMEEHNSGKTLCLRHRRPLKLLFKEEYDTRSEAVIRERQLKTGKGRVYIKEYLKSTEEKVGA